MLENPEENLKERGTLTLDDDEIKSLLYIPEQVYNRSDKQKEFIEICFD